MGLGKLREQGVHPATGIGPPSRASQRIRIARRCPWADERAEESSDPYSLMIERFHWQTYYAIMDVGHVRASFSELRGQSRADTSPEVVTESGLRCEPGRPLWSEPPPGA